VGCCFDSSDARRRGSAGRTYPATLLGSGRFGTGASRATPANPKPTSRPAACGLANGCGGTNALGQRPTRELAAADR
jgi:hypothetical protein